MRLKTLTAAALITAASFTAMTPLQAAEVELTLSHWLPPTHPLQPLGMEVWAQSIKDASDGRIEIKIYPSSQLGAAADHYDMARDGIVDIGFINPGYQPGRFPVISTFEIPFTVNNAKAGSRAFDEWYRQFAKDEMKDVYVCMVHLHDPGTLHGTKGPLQAPGDLRGKNIRPAHATMARMVNHLGGTSVQVPPAESRELLSKGTAEITASPWDSLFIFGVQDMATHHLDIPFYGTTFAHVMNRDKIDSLPADLRKVMDDHCTPEWAEKMASGWADAEASGYEKTKALPGHTFYKPTPEQMEEWRTATEPQRAEWKTAVAARGVDADAAWTSLTDTLKKHNSLVE